MRCKYEFQEANDLLVAAHLERIVLLLLLLLYFIIIIIITYVKNRVTLHKLNCCRGTVHEIRQRLYITNI